MADENNKGVDGMRRVHIVGSKNSGKTTLIVELVRELVARGYRVGTIKHSSHRHELDMPGKDSYRHRMAGGAPAAAISDTMLALYMTAPGGESSYRELAAHYAACDFVLVEGGLDSRAPRVEVWRQSTGKAPVACQRTDLTAVVSDDLVEVSVPVWPRSDVACVADHVLELAGLDAGGRRG